jgi:hypothetical protein
MSDQKKHPSFDTDQEGHHYVPGRSKGNADYFSKPIPPVRDAETGHPIGSNGKTDWERVIREVNERDGH